MCNVRKVISISLCALFAVVSNNINAQDTSKYIVSTGKSTLTFIPRSDLGFIYQSGDNQSDINAFNGMLSSSSDIEYREIRGSNKRNFSILMSESSDESKKSALGYLQSQNRSGYTAPLFSVNNQTVAVIPEIVVHLAFENTLNDLQALCETLDLSIKKKLEFTQKEYLIEVHGHDADSVFTAVKELGQAPFIEWATPNIASQPVLQEFKGDNDNFDDLNIPNDEYFTHLWHLYNTGQTGGKPHADINAVGAWQITAGDPNIIIAVIDTGVDVNHPDLIDNIVPGYDFFDDDNDPSPSLDNMPIGAHGTMCAGLAAAQGNNYIGVCGVAWKCKIMPIRIANGEDFIVDSDIATAIRWAASHGADVLSNSWGGDYPSQAIYSAILDVTKQNGTGRNGKGCVVCFAAGNWENGGPVAYPAAYPEVIAVGATDHEDQVWYYSASGPELDIVAPSGGLREDYFFNNKPFLWTTDITGIFGESIYNLDYQMLDYSDTMSGTSGACPLVAGVAALVLSVDPNLTTMEVRRILLNTAVDLGEPGTDKYYGFGRVDANAAVHLALNPPVTPPSSFITLYVDDDSPEDPCAGNPEISDPNEDGSMLHPFDSIQKAINFAISSETIIVLPGTYTGTGNFNIDFLGKPLNIYSETGPENCIIDCQDPGIGFYFHNNETHDAKLTGFTI